MIIKKGELGVLTAAFNSTLNVKTPCNLAIADALEVVGTALDAYQIEKDIILQKHIKLAEDGSYVAIEGTKVSEDGGVAYKDLQYVTSIEEMIAEINILNAVELDLEWAMIDINHPVLVKVKEGEVDVMKEYTLVDYLNADTELPGPVVGLLYMYFICEEFND